MWFAPPGQRVTYQAIADAVGLSYEQVRHIIALARKRRGEKPRAKRKDVRPPPDLRRGGKRAVHELRDRLRSKIADILWREVGLIERQLERWEARDDITALEVKSMSTSLAILIDKRKELDEEAAALPVVGAGGAPTRDFATCPKHLEERWRAVAKETMALDKEWAAWKETHDGKEAG